MRKLINIAVVAILSVSILGVIPVHAEDSGGSGKPKVQLTDQQKQELSKLQKEITVKKKALIQKYVEYGVIPKEKGDKIISHMEKRSKEMKESGFMPRHHWHKSKKWHDEKR